MALRYLQETELKPYINAGKIIEQYICMFKNGEFDAHRYVSIGKNKDGYYAFIHEVFDETDEFVESIYDFSSIDPDELNGVNIGPFISFQKALESLKVSVDLKSDKFHLTGYLDEIRK